MSNHQPLMPKLDRAEAKELAQPVDDPIEIKPALVKLAKEKKVHKFPKAMYTQISVTVSEGIPLKNIFIELARQAEVDL